MSKLRLAIISFAHMHAYSYADVLSRSALGELVAIAESDPRRHENLRKRYPFVAHWYHDYRDLLRAQVCDAVIVTSENVYHAPIVLDALAAGFHVLCEKPLATTVHDACAMIEAAERAQRWLMTAFPVRFSPAVACARRAVEKGELGHVLGGSTSNHGSMPGGWFVDPQLSGGGAVMDHTVHVVDLLRWIFRCEVETVYAEFANRLHPEIPCEDVGLLALQMENGAVFTLDTSWSRCKTYPIWGDVKLDIRGERARLSIDCFPLQVHRYDDARQRHDAFACADNLDELMITEFLQAISENRPPLVTGGDGLRALEVALAAYEAGKRKRPVAVDEIRLGALKANPDCA